MIVIYTPKVTNRITYTFDFVFRQYFGLEYEFTTDPEFAYAPGKTFISYAANKQDGFYTVYQDTLLLESDIRHQHLFVSRENGLPVFFQTTEHYNLKFDIFSCIFYLLSRYEEYLPHDKDEHGRYRSSNSILSNKEFNFSPAVEIWLDYLKGQLLQVNPSLRFKEYKFEYLPTIDIDNAFKYTGRNWFKHPPNILKKEGRNVLLKKEKDPYDTVDFIVEQVSKQQLKPVFFFLLSDKEENDSKVDPGSRALHSVIQKVYNSGADIGIHPSYLSLEENKIAEEKKLLEQIISSNVTISRQHFLRISLPDYFRALMAAGIQKDYSLSYPDVVGFRAGYSREFSFFDLEDDKMTSLVLQPSCWMDATYEYYQKTKDNSQIQQEILLLITQLRKINAKLVTIFHNDLIAGENYSNTLLFISQHLNL